MNQVYYWGAMGVRSGQINHQKHKICAALVRGYEFRNFDKHLTDITKRGAIMVAFSAAPVDFSSQERINETEPDFPDCPGWEDDATLSLIFFQAAKSETGPDLPPGHQRLVSFDDMQDEEFRQWVREKRARQRTPA